ncbi:MAG: hypothetical protein ACKOET_12610, partial [Verrucomicrobiota bacterium]
MNSPLSRPETKSPDLSAGKNPPAPPSLGATWMPSVAVLLLLGASLAWQRQAQQDLRRQIASLQQQLAEVSRPVASGGDSAPPPSPPLRLSLFSLLFSLS